ncbi:MAG: hypothetical protein ACM3L6_00480 [Deltaproteobacteria bacterium]
MFDRAKRYLTLQMLAAIDPQKLTRLSERMALKAFARAAAQTPAYGHYLASRGLDPQTIRSIEDFKGRVPIIDKDNTFRLYATEIRKLCLLGEIKEVCSILPSSGHSGCFSFGLNTKKELKKSRQTIDFMLDVMFQVSRRKTLLINALPMGVRVHAEAVTVVDTSVRPDIVLGIVRSFAPCYEQVLLIGENSFIKKVLEDGVEGGVDWKDIHLQIILGEIILAENLRSYMAGIVGIDPDAPQGEKMIASSFGVAEFGLNVFYETRALIRLRRLLQRDEKLRAALIGRELEDLPALFHYDPLRIFVEEFETADGPAQLVLTNLQEGTNIPLVRYNIKDEGLILSFRRIKEVLGAAGLESYLPDLQLPVVAVWGRDKLSLPLPKGTLRPERMREILYADPAVASCVTGNFRISAAKSGGLRLEVQAKERCDGLPSLEQHVRDAVLRHLPGAEIILYPYRDFPYGMTLDYERKFRYI